MKKNWMLFLFFAAFAALTFSGCSDDDNSDVPENTHLVSKEVQAAFNAKYPQAKDVEWELKGDYAVADFYWDGGEHSAWFNPLSAAWYMTETDGDTAVVLDTNLTPELIEEGFVRELVSKIQTMRKEAGFEVMDKIRVYAKDNDKIVSIMKNHGDEIKSEVLAEEIVTGETKGYEKEWNINSEKVTMAVERI